MFNNRIQPKHMNPSDVIDAQVLLTAVMQGKRDEANKLYTNNPNLLFIEVEARDPIGRTVTTSPLRAMAASGNITMLRETMPVLEDKNFIDPKTGESKSGKMLANEQLEQQFPNGFVYPPSQCDFIPLVNAITNDNDLIQNGFPNAETDALLTQIKKELMPSTAAETGHLINLNELKQAYEVYDQQWNLWNRNQSEFFRLEVVEPLKEISRSLDKDLDKGFKPLLGLGQGSNFGLGFNFASRCDSFARGTSLTIGGIARHVAKNQFDMHEMSANMIQPKTFIIN